MLISLTIENWRSFRDPVSFSMVASREKQHGERLSRISRPRMRLLPVAAVYGGNASGKSNLVDALAFAQAVVRRGSKADRPLAVTPFRLDSVSSGRPTRFTFVFLAGGLVYEYGFALTSVTVVEERLTEILGSAERLVFHRVDGTLALGPGLADDQRLRFAFDGTDDNQLYVNNAVSQKLDFCRPVYDWFGSLLVIGPHHRWLGLTSAQAPDESLGDLLAALDTGIARLDRQPVRSEDVGLPEALRQRLEQDLRDGEAAPLWPMDGKSALIAERQEGKLKLHRQVAHHVTADGEDVAFDLDDESDGSRRLIDLLPALLHLVQAGSERVLVVDEIDRSLHTLLLRRLLEWYLDSRSPDSRAQLLFTTHDVLLMDQSLFRRDEMWVTERDAAGASTLFALSDYQGVRYDKDIRKSYLQGRLGGIPRLLLGAAPPAPTRA
ncbi:MAG: AAA family ATPase [Propionibacteriaceae bacterium]|jgi:hypothetical protein|nr:AAA family ATPase [Propionibacteriaceae bacterium]